MVVVSLFTSYVGVTFVEAFLNDRAQIRRSMEQQTLIFVTKVLFLDLFLSMQVAGPEFPVFELLNFDYLVVSLDSVVFFVVADRAEHLEKRKKPLSGLGFF